VPGGGDSGFDPARDRGGQRQLRAVESVKKFYLIERQLTPETRKMTPTMKLKRNFVNKRYAVEIDAMYGERAWRDGRLKTAKDHRPRPSLTRANEEETLMSKSLKARALRVSALALTSAAAAQTKVPMKASRPARS